MKKSTKKQIKNYLRRLAISDNNWFKMQTKFVRRERWIPVNSGQERIDMIVVEEYNNY